MYCSSSDIILNNNMGFTEIIKFFNGRCYWCAKPSSVRVRVRVRVRVHVFSQSPVCCGAKLCLCLLQLEVLVFIPYKSLLI